MIPTCHYARTVRRGKIYRIVTLANVTYNRIISYLKPSRAPIHKLDGLLSLDVGDGSVDIPRYHVTSVQ